MHHTSNGCFSLTPTLPPFIVCQFLFLNDSMYFLCMSCRFDGLHHIQNGKMVSFSFETILQRDIVFDCSANVISCVERLYYAKLGKCRGDRLSSKGWFLSLSGSFHLFRVWTIESLADFMCMYVWASVSVYMLLFNCSKAIQFVDSFTIVHIPIDRISCLKCFDYFNLQLAIAFICVFLCKALSLSLSYCV